MTYFKPKKFTIVSVLCLIIILITIGMRFAYLDSRGFIGSDEYAYFNYVTKNLHSHDISQSTRIRSMWSKPTFFLMLYFESLMWKFTPYAMLLHSAVLGFITVILIGWIGEKYFGKNVGLFSMAIMSVLYFHVFYSRHMKALSTALFFSSLALALILRWVRTRSRFAIFSGGLFLSFALGSHPSFAISWLIVFSFMFFSIVWFSYRYRLSWRNIVIEIFIFLLGVIIPIFLFESFYFLTKYYFKSWAVGDMTYIKGLFENVKLNSSLAQNSYPSFKLYFLTLKNSGLVFMIIAAGGTLTILERINFRKRIFPFILRNFPFILISLIFWGSLIIFSLTSGVAGFSRNIFQLLTAYALLGGLGVSFLFQAVRLCIPSKTRKKVSIILKIIIVCSIIFYGYTKSKICLRNVSAAEQMRDYIKINSASMSRPRKPVYYWEHYYFKDRSLYCDTWTDVFRNYISLNSEYLVLLHPSMTNAIELLNDNFKPTVIFKHLNENRSLINFGLFDLNKERHIFKKLFGFIKVSNENYPSSISIKCDDASLIEKEFLLETKIFEVSPLKDAKLFLINGYFQLEDQGDILIMALGDKTNPYKYGMKIFQKKDSIHSLHSVWRLNELINKKIYVSFCFANNAGNIIGRKVNVTNFEISLYNLAPEFENLIKDVPLIIEDKERERQYEEILSRYLSTN